MSTLALQLVGPMQSYGLDAAHTTRRTWPHPTKSAVVGMLAAQLGRRRTADIRDLAALKMHVRLDASGVEERDFHTARNIRRASGTTDDKAHLIKYDHYLADAAFLVVLEGERPLLLTLEDALQNPRFFTYLGRKAYVASRPLLHSGVSDEDALTRLRTTPLIAPHRPLCAAILEDVGGETLLPDQPVSLGERTMRAVRQTTLMMEEACTSAA